MFDAEIAAFADEYGLPQRGRAAAGLSGGEPDDQAEGGGVVEGGVGVVRG